MKPSLSRTTWLAAASIVAATVVAMIAIVWMRRDAGQMVAVNLPDPEPLAVPRQTTPLTQSRPTAQSSTRESRPRRSQQLRKKPEIATTQPARNAVSSARSTQSTGNSRGADVSTPSDPPAIALPIARQALSWVGADPDAEEVWVAAINDPNMPAESRKDLIEDLNEEGFDDPKHLTRDDLPLIVNRLQLIEELAPQAVDDVNAAAFAEAYKDLLHMAAKLAQ